MHRRLYIPILAVKFKIMQNMDICMHYIAQVRMTITEQVIFENLKIFQAFVRI